MILMINIVHVSANTFHGFYQCVSTSSIFLFHCHCLCFSLYPQYLQVYLWLSSLLSKTASPQLYWEHSLFYLLSFASCTLSMCACFILCKECDISYECFYLFFNCLFCKESFYLELWIFMKFAKTCLLSISHAFTTQKGLNLAKRLYEIVKFSSKYFL